MHHVADATKTESWNLADHREVTRPNYAKPDLCHPTIPLELLTEHVEGMVDSDIFLMF
jgi:hypothetical protein